MPSLPPIAVGTPFTHDGKSYDPATLVRGKDGGLLVVCKDGTRISVTANGSVVVNPKPKQA
jgi:hypothetical protein